MPDHAEPRGLCAGGADEHSPAADGRAGLSRRHVVAGLLALAAGGCKILPIVSKEEAAQQRFNGADYVAKLWDAEVIPVVRDQAHPIETVGEKLRDMMPWIKKNKLVDQTKN